MLFTFLVMALLVMSYAQYQFPHSEADGLDLKIIGGSPIGIRLAPWQVSLEKKMGHCCGGSIISSNFVITAAHCIDGHKPSSLLVRAGTTVREEGGMLYKVAEIHQHPLYKHPSSVEFDYDIALLKLSKSLTYSKTIQPVILPSRDHEIGDGIDVFATGWGMTTADCYSYSTVLQGVTVQTVSNDQCRDAYYGVNIITPRMLCAGVARGGKDTCRGDSGGPLVLGNILLGITSCGNGCGLSDYPGIYTNVKFYLDFIQTITQFRDSVKNVKDEL